MSQENQDTMKIIFCIAVMVLAINATTSPITDINYQNSVEENSLRINFSTNSDKYSTYKLEMCRASGRSKCLNIYAFMEFLENVFSTQLSDFVHTGEYCVQISPYRLKTGEIENTRKLEKKLIFNITTARETPNCLNHTRNLIQEGTNKTSLRMKFVFTPRECLLGNQKFQMTLFRSPNDTLDDKYCDRWNTYAQVGSVNALTLHRVHNTSETIVEFNNLTEGFYFVRVIMNNNNACNGACRPLCSGILMTAEPGTDVVKDPSPERKVFPTYLYAVLPIAALIILAIAVMIWVKKYRSPSYSLQSSSISGSGISGIFEAANKNPEELEIVLLYSRDFEEHNQVVEAFSKFLMNCWKLKKVRFDENEIAVVSGDVYSWTEGVTRNAENQRFIIVESEGGVLQENGKRKTQVLQNIEGDAMDVIFPFALQMLKAGDNVVGNYKQIFVVRFGYTPEDSRLNSFVPKRRYLLPVYLFDLYHDMLDLQLPTLEAKNTLKNSLESKWLTFFDNECNPFINAAAHRIRRNPRLVEESYEEQDLV